MGVQDVVALTVVGAAVFYVGRFVWHMMNGGSGHCGGSCSSSSKSRSASQKNMSLTRTPLMSPDQIGAPTQPDTPPVERSSP